MWVICWVVLCKMCTESIKKHNYQGHLPSLMNHAAWFIPRHFFLVWILVKAAVCWAITSGNTELRVFFSGLASDISRIHVARTTSHKANVLMRCLVLFSFDNFWDQPPSQTKQFQRLGVAHNHPPDNHDHDNVYYKAHSHSSVAVSFTRLVPLSSAVAGLPLSYVTS